MPSTGPDNRFHIVAKKLTVRGFIVGDHAHRESLFRRHVSGLLRAGALHAAETHRQGIEAAMPALLDVLRVEDAKAFTDSDNAVIVFQAGRVVKDIR